MTNKQKSSPIVLIQQLQPQSLKKVTGGTGFNLVQLWRNSYSHYCKTNSTRNKTIQNLESSCFSLTRALWVRWALVDLTPPTEILVQSEMREIQSKVSLSSSPSSWRRAWEDIPYNPENKPGTYFWSKHFFWAYFRGVLFWEGGLIFGMKFALKKGWAYY